MNASSMPGNSASMVDDPRTAKNPKMSVNIEMNMPNDQAYARTFQKPAATQNQIAARMTAQMACPHCGSVNETSLPTNVKLAIPRNTSVLQTSNRPAIPPDGQEGDADGTLHLRLTLRCAVISNGPDGARARMDPASRATFAESRVLARRGDAGAPGPAGSSRYPSPVPKDMIDLAPPVEKAFLVAVDTGGDDGWTAEESLAELANLATTAGAEVVGAEWQNRRHVDPNWYVGKGKAEELVAAKRETGFDLLVADDELSPAQQRALEEPAQRQGHRPQPADPRHLRPPRPDPRGPAPGGARPARVPAARA